MVRIRKASISCVLALAAGSASAREAAQVVQVVVEFNAPPGCSDRETFATGLRARSDLIRVSESSQSGWIVGVRLTPKERGVHGELRLTDEHGESELRAVDGVDCSEVVEALSFTAALAIERTVERTSGGATSTRVGRSPDEPGRTSAGAPTSAVAPPIPSAATPPSRTAEASNAGFGGQDDRVISDKMHVGLIAFATKRIAPQSSFGLALVLSRQVAFANGWTPELALGALYVPSDALQPKSEIRVGFVGVTAQVCPATWAVASTIALSLCAAGELTRISVSDREVDVSLPSKRLTGFVGGLGRGRVRLAPHLEVAVELGLFVPLATRRYVTNFLNSEVGHTPNPAWQAGFGWLFGW